jgi:predicted MPP superfamily phosphohydrolase
MRSPYMVFFYFLSLSLHALVGWSLLPAFSAGHPVYAIAVGGVLVVSSISLPMGLFAARFVKPPLASVLTWLGLLCMGLFSTLAVLTLGREVLLVLVNTVARLFTEMHFLDTLGTSTAMAVPIAGFCATLLGFINARRSAQIVQINVPIANLPIELEGFTIAQISDVHVGPTIKTDYLQRIVDSVNLLNADMVAITGDLVDGPVHTLARHIAPLAGLRSTHGTFFVTGNHEYYSGVHDWIDVLRNLGVQVLMNEHVLVHHNTDSQDPERAIMVVAGVADYTAHLFDDSHRSDPAAALQDAPMRSLFRLLLAHQPRSAPAAAAAGFDLQLSGHTHGGQFWPWMYFVKFQQPFTAGLHKLGSMWVYTSRGTGYWGPPKRFGAPSEITQIRLTRAK